MHYEIWGLAAGNRIAVVDSQQEALSMVRAFLANGWSADELALGLVPDDRECAETLPPAVSGAALEEQVFGVRT